ncbi:MAG: hypothetical protein ABIV05_03320 [Actinomycetota bacterium]
MRWPRSSARRRALASASLTALLAVVSTTVLPGAISPAGAATSPGTVPTFGSQIEDYASYQGQTTCSPSPKKGAVLLQRWLTARYAGTGTSGIVRGCSVGGRSEHKEGRAFDWRVSVADPHERAEAESFVDLLRATDRDGNHAAIARRMGLMYFIWDDHIYSATSQFVPRPYVHPGCRTVDLAACGSTLRHRDHVHISMSWAGALARTSFWDGSVSGQVVPPPAPPRPRPEPQPAPQTAPQPAPQTAPRPAPRPVPQPAPRPVPPPAPKPAPEPSAGPAPRPAVEPTPPAPPTPTPATHPAPAPSATPTPAAATTGPPVLDQARNPAVLLSVPATTDGLTTAFTVVAGRTYRLLASGWYSHGVGSQVADAACSWNVRDATWSGAAATSLKLTVDGVAGWRSRSGGRCDAEEHVYVWDYTPARSGVLHLAVEDATRSDDDGALELRVLTAGADVSEYTTVLPDVAAEPTAPPAAATGDRLTGTEVVSVDAADGGRTAGVLEAGHEYTAEVAGTWSAGEGVEADAECTRGADGRWRPVRSFDPLHPFVDGYDLHADGLDLVPLKAGCDPGHVYRYRLVPGRTSQMSFATWDATPGDDVGALRVTMWPRPR